ncbi:glycosyltransferase family 2 protein [Candidatus Uhrbacteria bacterium]|nr:glycosyltransferase family 2 protein [Candidatus Uhrbacteria bacterium]
MPNKKVAVIIVSYNADRFIADCFGSLGRANHEGIDLQTIVIDNASKDGTVERIRREYPWATVVANPNNDGFAGGNNIGMRLAFEHGADYVYLLNHDTEVTPGFLIEAVRAMEADPAIGAAQSLLLLSPEKEKVNSTGNALHFLGLGYCMDYRRPASAVDCQSVREIAYASGAGVIYRVAALRQVGLFDEDFFMYHEDLDLCWRMRLAGWKNVIAPRSVVYHKYEFSKSIAKYYFMERNRYIVLLKNMQWRTLAVLAPFLAASEVALFVASVGGGWWRQKIKVYRHFLTAKAWRRIFEERRRVAAFRKIGDREATRLFTPTIAFQDVTGPFTQYVANPLMTATWALVRRLYA